MIEKHNKVSTTNNNTTVGIPTAGHAQQGQVRHLQEDKQRAVPGELQARQLPRDGQDHAAPRVRRLQDYTAALRLHIPLGGGHQGVGKRYIILTYSLSVLFVLQLSSRSTTQLDFTRIKIIYLD